MSEQLSSTPRDRFTVVRATARHAPGILACLEKAFLPFRGEYSQGAWLDTVLTLEALEARLRTMVMFVALAETGDVVGTLGCQVVAGVEGHLRGMAVWPERQGSGIAQALLDAAEAELRDSGCRCITLDTTMPLQRAIGFYTRNGFNPTGRITGFFGMPLFEYVKNL